MSVWVKSRHGLTPDLRQLPPTRTFKKKPPERHLRGLLGSSIGYIRQLNDTARAISPPNHVRYVAAMCQLRDLIPLEAATLRPVSWQHLRPRLDGHLLRLERHCEIYRVRSPNRCRRTMDTLFFRL